METVEMADVVGIGALNYDELYAVERIASAGEEAGVFSMKSAPGGSAANTIVGLARLGVSTAFIGVVGDDSAGHRIIYDFRREGVNVTHIKRIRGKTGRALSFVEPGGERALYVFAGVNDKLNISDDDYSTIKSAKLLHMSSFVSDEQLKMQIEIAKRTHMHTKISFSPGMLCFRHSIDDLAEIFARCSVVFLSRREVESLTCEVESLTTDEHVKRTEGARRILETGAEVVCVTLGERGCLIITESEEVSVPAFQTNVVDTTGAGDAFAAGFIFGMLRGYSIKKCGEIGNFVASCCIQHFGCRKGLPRTINLPHERTRLSENHSENQEEHGRSRRSMENAR